MSTTKPLSSASSLAARPAQPAHEHGAASNVSQKPHIDSPQAVKSPSTGNYAQALAEAGSCKAQDGDKGAPRPTVDRQMSWSEQDLKRDHQAPLMSPVEDKKEHGFSQG